MKKKLLSLVLTLAMVLGMMSSIPAMAEEDVQEQTDSAWLTVYYTNDVHTYINNDGLRYSNVAKLKEDKVAAGENVLLVDAGDHIQGTAYGSMDEGDTIIKLMNEAGYDLATLGNHEFDYGMEKALETIEKAEYPYISSNFVQDTDKDGTWENVLDSYKIFEVGDKKVAFVGITTPETFTKSTPAYFQDGNGNYIYDILAGEDGSAMYEAAQKAIDAAKAEGADYVIALGHLGVDGSSAPWRSVDLIANTTGLDAFIDGHSHTEMAMTTVADKDGNGVVLTQTGCYLANIGQMSISEDGTIQTELLKTVDGQDDAVAETEATWTNQVNEMLGTPLATTDIDFKINAESGKRAVRMYETNLADLDADAYYYYMNEVANLDCDVAFTNGGGVRADIPAGTWSYNTAKTVNPFSNVLCLMKVPGHMILDALEWGSRDTDNAECGGFLHTAGLTYKINTSIESTVQKDEKGVWTAGPSVEYRVYDVKIYNKETGAYEDLDLTKTYTIGGTSYTLRNQGDGFNMFQESDGMELVMEGISQDYLALSEYVKAFADTDNDGLGNIASANSPLQKYSGYYMNYEEWRGSGRTVCHKHVLTTDEAVAATCTETGLTQGYHCPTCGDIIVAQKTVPALGHSYGAWKVTKAATALATGTKTRTCSVCGEKETATIKKLTATIKVSTTVKKLKVKKSFNLVISKLAKGDAVKSVTTSKKAVATVKKVKTNTYKITGVKKGTAKIKVTLKSGISTTCSVTVK